MQIKIETLMLAIGIIASICSFAHYRSPYSYFLVATLAPAIIGVFCRFRLSKSELAAYCTVIICSIAISTLLSAYGSFFFTFIEPSQGIMVGGGWESIFAAALYGIMSGAVCAPFAMLIYAIMTSSVIQLNATMKKYWDPRRR
ncbi:MAG: hypothetical protein AAF939_00150 [Planctomycetota bacterium]